MSVINKINILERNKTIKDRFKFRYVFAKDFGGKTGICYKMPIFNLDTITDENFNKIVKSYIDYDYKLISIEQSTGLKDKNGKLIYEGDIVKFKSGNEYRNGKVEYSQTIWSISNAEFINRAYVGGALINMYSESEVIGNIYENSELLSEVE